MPRGLGGTLSQKIGPLPAWAWAGVAAVGIWFFLLRKPAAAAKTATAAGTPTGQATTDYSLGYSQGLQSAFPSAGTSSPTASTPRKGRTESIPQGQGFPQSGYGTIPVYTSPTGMQLAGWAPWDTELTITGPPQQGRTTGGGVSTWYPVDWGGGTGWMSGESFQSFSGGPTGVGGPGLRRPHAIGSRSANLWSDAHPLIGAKVHYPHYVNVGGPAAPGSAGRAKVGTSRHDRVAHQVAAQAGVHPARVQMLNPDLRHSGGRVRIA